MGQPTYLRSQWTCVSTGLGLLVDPPVPLWWGLPPIITLALALALAVEVALTLKVSESPLIGPGGSTSEPLVLLLSYCNFHNSMQNTMI